MIKKTLTLFLALLLAESQVILVEGKEHAEQQFEQAINKAKTLNLADKSFPDILQAIAQSFLGKPYQADILDQSQPEKLVISLEKFDCVLLVETVLALARNIATKDYTYPNFTKNIIHQRYWQGEINGYCSRFHYFSTWIEENQRQKIVENITPSLGAKTERKTLNFMSSHRQLYPQLRQSDKEYQCIKKTEASLKNYPISYIPSSQISTTYSRLQPGDIVGVVTEIAGLDVTHTGLVYRDSQGKTGLIHASPVGRVVIAPDLQRYISKVDKSMGILVVRPIAPH